MRNSEIPQLLVLIPEIPQLLYLILNTRHGGLKTKKASKWMLLNILLKDGITLLQQALLT